MPSGTLRRSRRGQTGSSREGRPGGCWPGDRRRRGRRPMGDFGVAGGEQGLDPAMTCTHLSKAVTASRVAPAAARLGRTSRSATTRPTAASAAARRKAAAKPLTAACAATPGVPAWVLRYWWPRAIASVDMTATPSEPPTCCAVLNSAAAIPACAPLTPLTAAIDALTRTRPMPMPMPASSSPGSSVTQYVPSTVIWLSHTRLSTVRPSPTTSNGVTPNRVTSFRAAVEVTHDRQCDGQVAEPGAQRRITEHLLHVQRQT